MERDNALRYEQQNQRATLKKQHLSPPIHWDDFVVGSVTEYGPRLVTREEIIAFASEFDPQPMHLDEKAARGTLLGGLAASGWHTCALLMRMLVDGFVGNSTSMGSPGLDEVKWLAPLRPGDEITVRATVLEKRSSKSRPDIGFVKFLFEVFNQSGTPVMTLMGTLMFGRYKPQS